MTRPLASPLITATLLTLAAALPISLATADEAPDTPPIPTRWQSHLRSLAQSAFRE